MPIEELDLNNSIISSLHNKKIKYLPLEWRDIVILSNTIERLSKEELERFGIYMFLVVP